MSKNNNNYEAQDAADGHRHQYLQQQFINNLAIDTQIGSKQQPLISPTFTYEQQSPGIFEIEEDIYGLTSNSIEGTIPLKQQQFIESNKNTGEIMTSGKNNHYRTQQEEHRHMIPLMSNYQEESPEQTQYQQHSRKASNALNDNKLPMTAEFPKEENDLQQHNFYYNQYLHKGSILSDQELRLSQMELDVKRIREQTLIRQQQQIDQQMLELASQQQQVRKELTHILNNGEQIFLSRLSQQQTIYPQSQSAQLEQTIYSTIAPSRLIQQPLHNTNVSSSTFNISSSCRTTTPQDSVQPNNKGELVLCDTRIQRMKNMLHEAKLKIEGATVPQVVEEDPCPAHQRKPSEFDASLLTQWRDDIDRVRNSLRRLQDEKLTLVSQQQQQQPRAAKRVSINSPSKNSQSPISAHKKLRFDSDEMYLSYLHKTNKQPVSSPKQQQNQHRQIEDRIKQAKVNLESKIAMRVKQKQERDSRYQEKTPQKKQTHSSGITPYKREAQSRSRSPQTIKNQQEPRATSRGTSRPKPEWNSSTKTIESPDAKKRPPSSKRVTQKNSPESTISTQPQKVEFKTISTQPDEHNVSSRNQGMILRSKISMPTKSSLQSLMSPPNEVKNQAVKVIQRLQRNQIISSHHSYKFVNSTSTTDNTQSAAGEHIQSPPSIPKKLNIVKLIRPPKNNHIEIIRQINTSPIRQERDLKSPHQPKLKSNRPMSTISARASVISVTSSKIEPVVRQAPGVNSRNITSPLNSSRPRTTKASDDRLLQQKNQIKPYKQEVQKQISQQPKSSRVSTSTAAVHQRPKSVIPSGKEEVTSTSSKQPITPAKVVLKDANYLKKYDDRLMRLIATSPSRTLKSKFLFSNPAAAATISNEKNESNNQ